MTMEYFSRYAVALIVMLVTLVESFPIRDYTAHSSDTCDFTVWDEPVLGRGVRQAKGSCSEGSVDWRNPWGAVRIFLQPRHTSSRHREGQPQGFRACFTASTSHQVVVKLSLEREEIYQVHTEPLESLAILNASLQEDSLLQETCVDSPSLDQPVILYAEAGIDDVQQNIMMATLFGHFILDYDLEIMPISSLKFSSHTADDSDDDCRPCTEDEILYAACASDFVVHGEIDSVVHQPEQDESQIHLNIHRMVRQTHSVFTASPSSSFNAVQLQPQHMPAPSPSQTDSAHLPVSGVSDLVRTLSGMVHAPYRCGVRHGDGRFVFMGRIRLKRAHIKCAPRFEDFMDIWLRATQQNKLNCDLE